MATMKARLETLPTDTVALHKMVQDYQLTVEQLQEKLDWHEEQFRLFQHRRFGASSERYPEQAELFNEAESILDALAQDEGELEETVAYQRNKPGRKPYPSISRVKSCVMNCRKPSVFVAVAMPCMKRAKTSPSNWKSFRHKSRSLCICRSNMAAVPVKMAC
jgi:Transposase C of IS166 homeodomain